MKNNKHIPNQVQWFFPGKNTPLKRYRSYFRNLTLIIPNNTNSDTVKSILCHSRGLEHAIKYCTDNNINPMIVSMDGVQVDIPKNLQVVCFRPESKKETGDENLYEFLIYYKNNIKYNHHPYMIKNVRDKIINILVED